MVENNRLAMLAPGSSFTVTGNSVIRSSTECYIQSMSFGELEKLKPIMTDPTKPRYAYNGCVEFIDPVALCRHLWSYGNIDGRPLNEFFTHIVPDVVQYTGQASDPWAGAIQANPFLKDPKYSGQCEYRIVFYSRPEVRGDHKIIKFPDADFFLKEAFRNDGPGSASLIGDPRTKSEIVACLADILALMEDRQTFKAIPTMPRTDEDFAEESRMRSEIETHLISTYLRPVMSAYWALRCCHQSDAMDYAFDTIPSVASLRNALSEYLYGRYHMFRNSEFLWKTLSEQEQRESLFDQLIADQTVPAC